MKKDSTQEREKVIQINEEAIKDHLQRLISSRTVSLSSVAMFKPPLWSSLKRSWAGEVSNVSVLVAVGVNRDGYRRILGICEGAKEDKAGWSNFLRHLKKRGLKNVRLFITDACMGLVGSLGEYYPEAKWQRCIVHFYRNVLSVVPTCALLSGVHEIRDINHGQVTFLSIFGQSGMKPDRACRPPRILKHHIACLDGPTFERSFKKCAEGKVRFA